MLTRNKELDNFRKFSPYYIDLPPASSSAWEKYQDKIDALPRILGDFLASAKPYGFILAMTQEFQLLEDSTQNLSRIIRDIILGELDIKKIEDTIQNKLKLNRGISQEISQKVVNQLFSLVWGEINKVQEKKFGAQTQSSNPNNTINLRDENS